VVRNLLASGCRRRDKLITDATSCRVDHDALAADDWQAGLVDLALAADMCGGVSATGRWRVDFPVLGEISDVETLAVGRRIRELRRLRKQYGHGRWRKRKGCSGTMLGRLINASSRRTQCLIGSTQSAQCFSDSLSG
jgi:hypothetical protein